MSSAGDGWKPELKTSNKPVYLRIADAIGDDILAGRLTVGERLPPLRDLAGALKLNYATVSRAYNEAQRRGLQAQPMCPVHGTRRVSGPRSGLWLYRTPSRPVADRVSAPRPSKGLMCPTFCPGL